MEFTTDYRNIDEVMELRYSDEIPCSWIYGQMGQNGYKPYSISASYDQGSLQRICVAKNNKDAKEIALSVLSSEVYYYSNEIIKIAEVGERDFYNYMQHLENLSDEWWEKYK